MTSTAGSPPKAVCRWLQKALSSAKSRATRHKVPWMKEREFKVRVWSNVISKARRSQATELSVFWCVVSATVICLLVFFPLLRQSNAQSTKFFIGILGFNTRQPPFNNPLARRAVAAILDRRRVTLSAGFFNVTATSVAPPGCVGHDPTMRPQPYDLQVARDLLQRSGSGQGLGALSLWESAERGRQGTFGDGEFATVARDLEVLGARLRLRQFSQFEAFASMAMSPEVHLSLHTISTDACDRRSLLESLAYSKGSLNVFGYNNPDVDTLIDRAVALGDPSTQRSLYSAIEGKVADEIPFIPLWWHFPAVGYHIDAVASDKGLTLRVSDVMLQDCCAWVEVTIENTHDVEANLFEAIANATLTNDAGTIYQARFTHTRIPDRIAPRITVAGRFSFDAVPSTSRKILLTMPNIRVLEQTVTLRVDISPPWLSQVP